MEKRIRHREPEFMKELHKIRTEMAEEWKKLSLHEMVKSINESGRWQKEQLAPRKNR